MDVAQLHDCFLGTLQADPNIRKQAELQLAQISKSIGFLSGCLDILINENVEHLVKTSCSIYFKNKIVKYWNLATDDIDNDERPVIREKILFSIVKLDKSLRNQLLPALNQIIQFDYPENWSNLLDNILNLINGSNNDLNSLYVGIYCFTELCRTYRWQDNTKRSQSLDPIIINFFPSLLNIGDQLIESSNIESSFEISEILKLVLKCYKFVTYMDLPLSLQSNDEIMNWINFHVKIISFNFNEDSLQGFLKSQKWAYANLYRLFQRYGTKSLSGKYQYDEFRVNFKSNILPNLINVYINILEKWTRNETYLIEPCLYYLLSLFEQCLLKKSTFQLIEPHFNYLITEIAFKLFMPKNEDLELYDDEPEEYIHKIFEIIDENTGEDALHSFLFTLVEKREDYLVHMFQFILNKLNELNNLNTENIEIAMQKESIMKFLSPISYKLSTINQSNNSNPILNEIESFLVSFIFPNFNSNFKFIKARTCNLISKFDSFEFRNEESIKLLFNGIMECFSNDTNGLPCQIQSALAIQSFINLDEFKNYLESLILQVMEKLMDLSNKFDSDILPAVMQELVESFPSKLEPFAEQLMEQLSIKVISLLNSINEMSNSNYNDVGDFDSFSNDKVSTALGILNTMITILLYFENSTEIISKLEVSYSQVIKTIFTLNIEDFYSEACELIENTLFLTRNVSPIMWNLLNDLIECLLNDENGDITLYLEDSLPALKNYLVYGNEVIKSNTQIQDIFFKLIMKVYEMSGEDEGAEDDYDIAFTDLINVSDLSTTFVLSSLNKFEYLPILVKHSIKNISSVKAAIKKKNEKYIISFINVVIASLIVDPNTALQTLIETQTIELFFNEWFALNEKLTRVFDIKLSIIGLISLLNIDFESMRVMRLDEILPSCGEILIKLFIKVPQAIKDLETKRKEYTDKDWANEQTYSINQNGNFDDDDEDDGAGFDEEEYDFNNQLMSSTGKFNFNDFDDDELEEDPYSNTCLDKVNIFETFKEFMINVQTKEADKHNFAFSKVSENDQQVLNNILTNL